jgi:chlorobactene glucosyltransferase
VNGYFLATTLVNLAYFRRATRAASVTGGPLVSVIIPARDEEAEIGRCVDSVLAQEYADFELIVVDDGSTDATAALVAERAERDPRLRLLQAGPLPEGWLGKLHAMARGADAARGEILLFTDADTTHRPHSISWAVTNLEAQGADMLSGYLLQEYGGPGEGMVVPVIYLLMMLVPFPLVPRRNHPRLSAAIGQYVAVQREAYDAVGGFASVKDAIVDDMALAMHMKDQGRRVVFLDAKRVATCRMFSCYRHACRGIKRCVYSAIGGNPLTATSLSAVVLAFILAPAVIVAASVAQLRMPPEGAAIAAAMFLVQWALVAYDREAPLVAVVLYPVVFANLLGILVASMLRTGFGAGVEWKGRLVRVNRAQAPESPAAERT